MKIVTLIEDTPGEKNCLYEHGLSFYIETKRHKMLLDTGASDAFFKNAELLGIDLEQIDTVVLSHGHYDHCGGLMPLMQRNTTPKIYMNKKAGADYYSIRENGETYIGIDKKILELSGLVLVNGQLKIDEELSLFSDVTGRRFWPKGNLRLKRSISGELVQDEFNHEQCLVVEQEGKHILLSGCAHNGILNILEKYREIYRDVPDIVISGFHMIQKDYTKEDIENIRSTAKELAKCKTVFYTGHCTGEVAFEIMKEIMGEQLQEIHSGLRIL